MADNSADPRGANDRGPSMAQLRREFREEAIKMRNEMREEFQRKMAEQMAEMASQQRGGHHGAHRGPGRPRGNLSREAIVDVAMRIMAKRGLNKVTMRAVAHELNTGPASIYVHVSSMAELHGHMLDRIIGGIDLSRAKGTWRERITQLLQDLVRELLVYPELARSALEVRPYGVNTLRFADTLMGLLAEGGTDEARRALGLDLLMLWTMGGAAEHAADAHAMEETSEIIQSFRAAVANEAEYPNLYAVRDVLFIGNESERFAWGVDALLTGIAASSDPSM